MLTHGVDPQHVQKTLRHASLQMTLDTYAHWLPTAGRRANVVSTALHAARGPAGPDDGAGPGRDPSS